MARYCVVPGCENQRTEHFYVSEGSLVSFHRFPSQIEYRYQEWIKNIGLIAPPLKTSVVCSAHFEENCFHQRKYTLKSDAIPYLLRLVKKGEHVTSTSSTASECDAEKSSAGCSSMTSQSLRDDLPTVLGSDDDEQESKIVSIASRSSTSLESDAEDTFLYSKRQRLENTVRCSYLLSCSKFSAWLAAKSKSCNFLTLELLAQKRIECF